MTAFVREVTDDLLVAGIPDPEHLELMRRLGLRSVIIAALRARGRLFGTITLASAEPGRLFEQADVQLAEELARARRRGDRQRAALHRAQPHRPHPAGQPAARRGCRRSRARLAARYRAAGEHNEVGGDFYDAFERPPTDWALVVGDVSGKGAEAAAVTALARYTLRAAALAGPPEQALRRLNTAMLSTTTARSSSRPLAYLSPPATAGIDVRLSLGRPPAAAVVRRDGDGRDAGRSAACPALRADIDVHDTASCSRPATSAALHRRRHRGRAAPPAVRRGGPRRLLGDLAGQTPAGRRRRRRAGRRRRPARRPARRHRPAGDLHDRGRRRVAPAGEQPGRQQGPARHVGGVLNGITEGRQPPPTAPAVRRTSVFPPSQQGAGPTFGLPAANAPLVGRAGASGEPRALDRR